MTSRAAAKPVARLPDPAEIDALARGAHGDPFAILGLHGGGEEPLTLRVFAPEATAVEVTERKSGRRVAELPRLHAASPWPIAFA